MSQGEPLTVGEICQLTLKPVYSAPEKTLRDEFAMAALTGMLADGERNGDYSVFADDAYAFADAMLMARKESHG